MLVVYQYHDTKQLQAGLERRQGGQEAQEHHAEYPCLMREVWHTPRRLHRLREGCQRGWLHQGSQCHDGPGRNLILLELFDIGGYVKTTFPLFFAQFNRRTIFKS